MVLPTAFSRPLSFLLLVLLVGCGSKQEQAPVIGQAFVGPATIPIRKDLSLRSPAVATLKHGERVDIVQVRRRFVRLRTPSGIEGWTDSRQLLTVGQMNALRALTEHAASLPSQGWANILEPLNLHSEPSRYSPSIYQIPENTTVAVIGHRVSDRVPPKTLPALVPPPPPRKPKSKGKEKDREKSKSSKVPPPPMPAAPKPPANWLELSQRDADPEAPVKDEEPLDAKPVPKDDWTLVRTKDKRIGWVLTRPLVMGIPDEVAQYAEGHHISAFFPVGDVTDPEQGPKHHWLWATINKLGQTYEFDGFRVFTWNTARHRYETAYRERDLKGYYPVTVAETEVTEARKTFKAFAFTFITEDETGQAWRRRYVFVQNRVRFQGKEPIQLNHTPTEVAATTAVAPPPAPDKPKSFWDRLKFWK